MSITVDRWKNKVGTGDRKCNCGSWKKHWINALDKSWPKTCSIKGCSNDATLGAHIINKNVEGEQIVPACDSCNKRESEFLLKVDITCVPANKSKTCDTRDGWI